MQRVLIPSERVKLLEKDKSLARKVEELCKCKIDINEEGIDITGDAYGEFSARNILFAFGRGFDVQTACLLHNENFYFSMMDLAQFFGSDNRIRQVKARIIGKGGKAKENIERVSKARISIYGDTVSFIGTEREIEEAQTCVNALIDGDSHRSAYMKMEAVHRRNRLLAKGL
ncbi:MAG: hypothetical protein QXW10_00935 [Candidatus Micrarchaeaceae archaeon]